MEAERLCKVCKQPLKNEHGLAKVHKACAPEWKQILRTKAQRARRAKAREHGQRSPP